MIPRPIVFRCWIALLAAIALRESVQAAVDGNPLTRAYSFEEIGCSADGVRLGTDPFGRIILAQGGEITALNDTTWRKVWSDGANNSNFSKFSRKADGTVYFGTMGSWGTFERAPGGNLQARILTPADAPKWVPATNFDQILHTPAGIFFSGMHGVAFRDATSGQDTFFEITGAACVFPYQGSIFVSTFDSGILRLDPRTVTATPAPLAPLAQDFVVATVGDGDRELMVATARHRLYILKSGKLEALRFGASIDLPGRVTALVGTPEGSIAAAIAGWGVVILGRDGQIKHTCNGFEYTSVATLESSEPGVLWAATDGGLLKILYGQPVTTFNRSIGLPVEWPQIVSWNGSPMVASGGHLYEPTTGTELAQTRFRYVANEPDTGGWGIAVFGSELLVGNGQRVYRTTDGNTFAPIVPRLRVARLVAIDDQNCMSIGAEEIAALRLRDGVWTEAAPRIPGVGYPYIVHSGPGSAWIELGLNRVARLSLADGRLKLRLFEDFPWAKPSWVNISILGTTVVLCGDSGDPVLLDDRTLAADDDPIIRRLFTEAPTRIHRINRDRDGTFWISHGQGLYSAHIDNGSYRADLASFAGIGGPTPRVHALSDGSVWASTGNTLYRLRKTEPITWPPNGRPLLVAMRDSRTGAPFPSTGSTSHSLGTFRYAQNSIQFDLFVGSYAFVRPPLYEFRLNEGGWMQSAAGSSLFIPDLHEGDYRLQVRLVGGLGLAGRSEEFRLAVLPPWYRTWYAWVAYPIAALVLIWTIVRLSVRHARRRQATLEKQIAERTNELRDAMTRLQQEALTSAILTERNRLAAEIHDSIEQGFAGLALQVESTADLNGCPPKVRTGLVSALNMIAFCRTEIRHAIRGLHSPALSSADLGSALRQIVAQLAPLPDFATIRVEGTPRRIASATEHHLLRIAQEAVANALKHSSAKHLEVALLFGPAEIRLSVSDDGRGFTPEDAIGGNAGHLGLRSLRNRATKIGGTIEIRSQPGAGTTITVTIPDGADESTNL